MSDTIEKRIDRFSEWLDALTEIDRINFVMLVNLRAANKLVADLPSGEYRDMAVVALALLKVNAAMQKEAADEIPNC